MNPETPLTREAIQTRIDRCHNNSRRDPLQKEAWLERAAQWQAILDQRTEDGYYDE